ncbi:DUF2252 family protein [Bradyrhizobium oligotrophicum S58]
MPPRILGGDRRPRGRRCDSVRGAEAAHRQPSGAGGNCRVLPPLRRRRRPGRPRYVVVATWRGGRIVREAKALVPSAWTWAKNRTNSSTRPKPAPPHRFVELSTGTYRAPDPFLHVHRTVDGDYVVRRLSADSRKIDLGKQAGADLKLELLRGMGTDLASIHAADGRAGAEIAADLRERSSGWLRRAARAAREATEKDHDVWRRKAPGSLPTAR